MVQVIKNAIKRMSKYDMLQQKRQIDSWRKSGSPIPPPHVLKQQVIREYAKKSAISTLIETGTYTGAMVEAMRASFEKIYSIELDKALYEQAQLKFSPFSHISILHGDSGVILPEVLKDVAGPCLFWLDGHFSAGITAKGQLETPIIQELDTIFQHYHPNHVILIDDAHLFVGRDDYPSVKQVEDLVLQGYPDWVVRVDDNIIRIHASI